MCVIMSCEVVTRGWVREGESMLDMRPPPMIWYDGHSIPWGSDDCGA